MIQPARGGWRPNDTDYMFSDGLWLYTGHLRSGRRPCHKDDRLPFHHPRWPAKFSALGTEKTGSERTIGLSSTRVWLLKQPRCEIVRRGLRLRLHRGSQARVVGPGQSSTGGKSIACRAARCVLTLVVLSEVFVIARVLIVQLARSGGTCAKRWPWTISKRFMFSKVDRNVYPEENTFIGH